MKKLATILFAALCAISSAEETPISVNLSISRPQASESKTESKPKSNRHGRSSSRTSTETKNSIYSYTGKVGCNLPKDATATVTVEAYFITRSVGGKGAKDVLSPRNEIDKFVFGGDNPASYAFSLTSPQFAQTTDRYHRENFAFAAAARRRRIVFHLERQVRHAPNGRGRSRIGGRQTRQSRVRAKQLALDNSRKKTVVRTRLNSFSPTKPNRKKP